MRIRSGGSRSGKGRGRTSNDEEDKDKSKVQLPQSFIGKIVSLIISICSMFNLRHLCKYKIAMK